MYCSRCGTWAPDTEALCGQCGAVLQLQNTPPPPPFAPPPAPEPPAAPRYSGFWRRLCAAVVDLMILMPFGSTVEIALGRRPYDPVEWNAGYWGIQGLLVLMGWAYSALLESSRWQGTLGQQLLDIRVTDLAGRRIGFARATGRHFGQLVSVLTLGLGYLMIAFTARKQALHDVMSGCVLVRREPAPRDAAVVVTLPAPAPPAPALPQPENPWSSPPMAGAIPPSTPHMGPSA